MQNQAAKVISINKNTSRPNKYTHSNVDIVLVTPKSIKAWADPPFQRPLVVNNKVRALAERIKQDRGIIPGLIVTGVVNNITYLVDGQHRREAFLISECEEGMVQVSNYTCDSMGALGRLFVEYNSRLRIMRPDDILRGLEGTTQALRYIREQCNFVGYDSVRRNDHAPLVSMSAATRLWFNSIPEVPTSAGLSASDMAEQLTMDDATALCEVLNIMHKSWGRDPSYYRLWNSLNLVIAMWLYRRTVITNYSPNTIKLEKSLFQKCLMSLSADAGYLDWLHGRNLNERDRAPCYNRMKIIFAKRVYDESGKKPRLPSPAWAHS